MTAIPLLLHGPHVSVISVFPGVHHEQQNPAPEENRQESPGGDVVQKHPSLPDDVYRRVVSQVVARSSAEGLPIFQTRNRHR